MANFVFSAFADEAGSSLDEQISALLGNGISYIEPRNIENKSIMEYSDEELYQIKATLDKNGIKVGSFGSPIGKYPIEDDFDSYISKVKRAVEIAKIFDTKYIRMFSFYKKEGEWTEEKRAEVVLKKDILHEEKQFLCIECW